MGHLDKTQVLDEPKGKQPCKKVQRGARGPLVPYSGSHRRRMAGVVKLGSPKTKMEREDDPTA